MLKTFSDRLLKSIRNVDSVGRIGGDEFIVILTELNNHDEIKKISFRMLKNINIPININQLNIQLTISIGIAIYPKDANNIEDLIKKADSAMYEIKKSGKNNFKYFMTDGTPPAPIQAKS